MTNNYDFNKRKNHTEMHVLSTVPYLPQKTNWDALVISTKFDLKN